MTTTSAFTNWPRLRPPRVQASPSRVRAQQPWWGGTRLNALRPAVAETRGVDQDPARKAGRVVGRRVRACSCPIHLQFYGISFSRAAPARIANSAVLPDTRRAYW